jgi:aminopeptidase N
MIRGREGAMLRLFRVAAFAITATLAAGSARAIDPFFPTFGNNGIDVVRYGLDLDVTPTTGQLNAWAVLDILAEKELTRFALDLHALKVSKVTVNGIPAGFGQTNDKLIIAPRRAIPKGMLFRVYISYSGVPDAIEDPTDPRFDLGWFKYRNATYVVSEPIGASTFFPANDEPTDKARFKISVTVPSPYGGIANGKLVSYRAIGAKRHFVWEMDQPMTTWLATVHVNRFKVRVTRAHTGTPVTVFYTAATPQSDVDNYALAAKMLPFFERLIGPYPFETYGSVVVDDPLLYYALETQTVSTFPLGFADEEVVAHELAHQWFGNSASVAKWEDLWIAEGAATYFEMLWPNRNNLPAFDKAMRKLHRIAVRDKIGPAVVDAPEEMFSDRTYVRGSLALYALRLTVGDRTFFSILRTFVTTYRGRNATSQDFIRIAVSVSGNGSVAALLHDWLYEDPVPPLPGAATAAAAESDTDAVPDVVGLSCGHSVHRLPDRCH